MRRRAELDSVDALVIPGGESTAMSKLLREFELLEPLRARLADGMPAYGSCAGMILLATEIADAGVPGREALPLGGDRHDRAAQRLWPAGRLVRGGHRLRRARRARCTRCSSGRRGWSASGRRSRCWRAPAGHPVAVRQGRTLATAFHPEMTGDRRVHRLFVDSLSS